jgi:hypothetical protein
MAAGAVYAATAFIGFDVQHEYRHTAAGGDIVFQARSASIEVRATQKFQNIGNTLRTRYEFTNFNKDILAIAVQIGRQAFAAYIAQYGYSSDEVQKIKKWYESTYSATQPDERGARLLENQYYDKLRTYLASRCFKLLPGNYIAVDVPEIVRRNRAQLKSVALEFAEIARRRGYGSEMVIGAVLAFVQTAVRFEVPPLVKDGHHTGGLLPPLETIIGGSGDCDTKTALLAAILGNWDNMAMVGIAVPEHYLMAIRRNPTKGDLFIEYKGQRYVVVEPAGPAWLPIGMAGQETIAQLGRSDGFRLEPFQ